MREKRKRGETKKTKTKAERDAYQDRERSSPVRGETKKRIMTETIMSEEVRRRENRLMTNFFSRAEMSPSRPLDSCFTSSSRPRMKVSSCFFTYRNRNTHTHKGRRKNTHTWEDK